MTKEAVIILRDDLTKQTGDDVVTISFAYGKTAYEIEMGEASQAKFEKALEPFIAVARKATKKTKSTSTPASDKKPTPQVADPDKEYRAKVRAWARETERECPIRGRIPQELIDQYEEALHRYEVQPT